MGRGLSAAPLGSCYEYYKVCREDDVAFGALHAVAQRIASAEVPLTISNALGVVLVSW